MAADHFCLRWNNYHSNMVSELDILRTEEYLVDVTLCCEGFKFRAHKVILSACSPYFRNVFKENPCEHPVVILNDVSPEDVEALLSFIYQGVVYVSEKKLSSFLQTAELLQIKGLAGAASSFNEETNGKSVTSGGSPVKRRKGAPVRLVKQDEGGGDDSGTAMEADTPETDPSNAQSNDHSIKAENYDANSTHDMRQDEEYSLEEETGSENGCDGVVGMEEKSPGCYMGPRPPPPLLDTSQASANLSTNQIHHHTGNLSVTQSNQVLPDISSAQGGLGDRNGRRPCPLCTKVISNKSNLLKHMRIRHTDAYNPACCVLCNKLFKNKYSLRAHLNIYHKEYINPGSSPQTPSDQAANQTSHFTPPQPVAQMSTHLTVHHKEYSSASPPQSTSQTAHYASPPVQAQMTVPTFIQPTPISSQPQVIPCSIKQERM